MDFISDLVLPQLDAFENESLFRVVQAFSDIEGDAAEYQESFFRGLMKSPVEGDPALAAESARVHAVAHYAVLRDTRQGLLNLLGVALYHLHEQHLSELKRNLRSKKRKVPQLAGLTGYERTEELRHLANAVKHAEGPSARALRDLRPDLFVQPPQRRLNETAERARHLQNPLGGADLFVREQDLTEYADALKELWIDIRAKVA